MAESLISIVDEQDNPIGAATKAEVWAKGLRHRIVHVMVENTEGAMLLQKRSAQMRLWPNCWTDSASGHVDAGEDYDTAAQRETTEELGMTGELRLEEVGDFYYSGEYDNKKLNRFNKVYRTVVDSAVVTFELQESEVAETRWFSADAVKELVRDSSESVTPSLSEIITRFY